MLAALDFRNELIEALSSDKEGDFQVIVELFGALAATGIGHGTHRAVLAGLTGQEPEKIDTDWLNALFGDEEMSYDLNLPVPVIFRFGNFRFEKMWEGLKHPNTLKFKLLKDSHLEKTHTYFSIGGGFIQKEGRGVLGIEKGRPKYAYNSLEQLITLLNEQSKTVDDLLLENELDISGLTEEKFFSEMNRVVSVMRASTKRGLKNEGILPGGLEVNRRARSMFSKATELQQRGLMADSLFARMNAYALAVSEENAAGSMVVTAPTNGAAGIIPAALEYLVEDCQIEMKKIQRGLLVAALIGYIIKDNASISGAELGCQAEVGSAASMAAALFSFCLDGRISVIAMAAEIAMEHHLGMTCDPVKGLVQIPCIERNANGVIKAYNAYLLASGRQTQALVSFDQVVEVMRQTGLDLSNKYKETASGGLATHFGWGKMPGS